MKTNKEELKKEKEILQYLYDKGFVDFSGDEDEPVLHANVTGRGLIDIFQAGQEKSKDDILKIIDDIFRWKTNSVINGNLPKQRIEDFNEGVETQRKAYHKRIKELKKRIKKLSKKRGAI